MATVKVTQGFLKGGKSKTDSGFDYYEFLGVPYAKPPVGELRFKSPQPPELWDSDRDATVTTHGINNIACQATLYGDINVFGNEDCLYLNVYTPQLPSQKSPRLPVIVYIHGGGFVVGNGIKKSENGPDYMIEENVVVVTINYRLGVFGFLSLDIPEAAGNMGLKDQVKALEWVRDNIEKFGGDKDNVTIMGLSAGSASVDYLVLSPKARGLFHKAILQSGSTLNHWAINYQAVDLARELVKILDYKGSLEDNKAIHDFLLAVPPSNLSLAAAQAVAKFSPLRLCFGFVPTVEKDYGNGDAFLTTHPYRLLKEGNFNRVPMIRGFCNREGSATRLLSPQGFTHIKETNAFIDLYPYDIDSNKRDEYNSKLSRAYVGDTKSDDKIDRNIEDFFGDLDFAAGVWIAGKNSSLYAPTYMYVFEYAGKINTFKNSIGVSSDEPGAMHGDDMQCVLKYGEQQDLDENDFIVRKRIITMFTNLVKFGNPVPSTSDLIPVNWQPYSEESKKYLRINNDLYIKSDYEPEKMAMFEKLYDISFAS